MICWSCNFICQMNILELQPKTSLLQNGICRINVLVIYILGELKAFAPCHHLNIAFFSINSSKTSEKLNHDWAFLENLINSKCKNVRIVSNT